METAQPICFISSNEFCRMTTQFCHFCGDFKRRCVDLDIRDVSSTTKSGCPLCGREILF